MIALSPAALARLYALYGPIAVFVLALLMPPFQNADEPAHLIRADQIAHGGFIARADPGAPALIDLGIIDGAVRFSPVTALKRPHVGRDLYVPIGWGSRIQKAYPSSAIYPPFFYLPTAAALAFGIHNHLTVLPAAELARAVSGLVCVAIGAAAIAMGGASALWLFAILTLPMALSMAAAASQDGPMIAACALAASLMVRLQAGSCRRPVAGLCGVCVLLAMAAAARPPYLGLALLPLLASGFSLRVRCAAAAFIVAVTIGWSWIALAAWHTDVAHFHEGMTNPSTQALGLVTTPGRLPMVLFRTLHSYGPGYIEQFIGRLGWLDIGLPRAFRRSAMAALLLAAASCLLRGAGRQRWRRWALPAVCLLVSAMGIFLIQYLTWTRPGSLVAEGVQGRYFLPLAAFLPLLLARPAVSAGNSWQARLAAVIAWPVALLPIAAIGVMVHQIILRYYL